jgi:hypothetical protein
MDFFCINRGTLLDMNTVVTLDEPEKHTVHCLVDISVCRNQGYEVLAEAAEGAEHNYCRAYSIGQQGAKGFDDALAMVSAFLQCPMFPPD